MSYNPNIPAWGNVAETDIGAIRTNLNRLRENEAGASEPANPVAHMWWPDTTTGWLRQRNAANNAWVNVWRLGEQPSLPAGAVQFFAMSSVPTGWLACNGAAVSRSTFAALFAAISTVYGAGDGSTTFNVPDLRGDFLRGWDDGRGVDSGRLFASTQLSMSRPPDGMIARVGSFGSADGAYDQTGDSLTGNVNDLSSWPDLLPNSSNVPETRPRNVPLRACIKF